MPAGVKSTYGGGTYTNKAATGAAAATRFRGEAEMARQEIANNRPTQSGLPGPGQSLPDPMELYLRTQAELAGIAGYPSGSGGGGSSHRRGGGGGGRGGGGGGGGGGAADAAAYQGQLAALNAQAASLADLYNGKAGMIGGYADAARARAAQQNAVLAGQLGERRTASEAALAQRTQAIQSILAQAEAQRASYGQGALTDLSAQGISTTPYQQAAQLEQGRLNDLGMAQGMYGANLDNIYRQANNARDTYGNLAQQDFANNIEANQQLILGKLAQQRAEQEAQLASQRAQIQAEAAARGVKL